MNEDNGSFNSKRRIIILITAAVLLLAGFFVLYKNLFGKHNSDADGSSDYVPGEVLPDIAASGTFEDVFYGIDQNDPLKHLIEFDNFSATVTIADAYNTFSSVSYSVMRFDGKFRMENSSAVVIYDGEKLYKRTPTYTVVEERENYDMFSELGISDLSGIREELNENSSAQVAQDGKNITVSFFDESGSTAKSCVISAESGIVISETTLYNDSVRREVNIGNVKILTADDVTPDMFTLPE